MEILNILTALKNNYEINIQNIELFREGGNKTYIVYGAIKKYFLKVIHLPRVEMETALGSIDIQVYLLKNEFPVIPIIFTKDGAPCVRINENKQDTEYMFILYDFISGGEPANNKEDMETAGMLVGKLHHIMKNYNGRLIMHDKYYFIDRYIEILRKKNYPKAELFAVYGNEVWEKIKNLPRGYCHCDLYDGNINKTDSGDMYVVDFDTSCNGFPAYDIALFCNRTHYFNFDYSGYEKTRVRLNQFLTGYVRYYSITEEEISAFYDLLAVYHFQLQAGIIERFGYDCVDNDFFNRQYDWLLCWKEQCLNMKAYYKN